MKVWLGAHWCGGEGVPVAFMPMRETCGKFIKLGEQE